MGTVLEIVELLSLAKLIMDPTTLVLIGRTGNGKSSTANSILGRNEFASESSTTCCQLGQCEWKDGRTINVVDTPGLFDRNASKFTDREIVKCIQLARDGVHAFILVLSIKNRFTEEEADILDILQMLFGPKSINYMIIVFTGADDLEINSSYTFEDYVNASTLDLKGLIRRCNSRVVLFDNTTVLTAKMDHQITKLMEMVDRNFAENGNRPYTNALFENAKSMTMQLYYNRDKDKAYEDQIKQQERFYEEQIRLLKQTMAQNMNSMQQKMDGMDQNSRQTIQSLQDQINSLQRSRYGYYRYY
ncbi:hypothetical protein SUGI_0291350 [Cryptomeria japonica]|nr:hypothetical protein SUGI_0291350 [Cryptomeria japonica]